MIKTYKAKNGKTFDLDLDNDVEFMGAPTRLDSGDWMYKIKLISPEAIEWFKENYEFKPDDLNEI